MPFMIAFDLEGPLSPQDNAYEVMGRVPEGYGLFERLSRYDDVLTLRGRKGYEPGDTLTLIVPFLLANRIDEADIRNATARAGLVPGAREAVQALQQRGLPVVVISTSYCQHAHGIAGRVGVPADRVACTLLPVNEMRSQMTEEDRAFVLDVQRKLLAVPLAEEERINRLCDEFFWNDLPSRSVGKLVQQVQVVGGARKTAALTRFARAFRAEPARLIAVGDSITDFKMLAAVEEAGGLSIVFNGNEYAVPFGTCGVAAVDLRAVLPVVEAFLDGGRANAMHTVEELAEQVAGEEGPVYNWLLSLKDYSGVVEVHKRFRRKIRGQAAKLG
ncbi:MAG: haloacid dehalogenase-like hydrolase [Bacillota bacterium]